MNNPLVNKILLIILGLALLFFGLQFGLYILNILMPFVIGFVIAFIANPLVKLMRKYLRFPRGLASLIAILLVFTVLGFGISYLFGFVSNQVNNVTMDLKDMADSAIAVAERTYNKVQEKFPQYITMTYEDFVKEMVPKLNTAITDSTVLIGGQLFQFAKSLPSMVFFTIIALISSYYISVEFDKLMRYLKRFIARYPAVQSFVTRLKSSASLGMGSWLKAQLIVMFFLSIIGSIGFLLLKYEHPYLMGVLLAFFDALPIFGSGAVLFPLFVYNLIFGNVKRAIFHLLLYAAIAVTRQIIEPRVLSNQIGINPLLTLITLYTGYRIAGIVGMILGVMLLVVFISVMGSRKSQHTTETL